MPTIPASDWHKEFGIQGRKPPAFFSDLQEIDEAGSAAPLPTPYGEPLKNFSSMAFSA